MKRIVALIINELFQILVLSYCALLLINFLTQDLIIMVVNPSIFLYLIVLCGIVLIFLSSDLPKFSDRTPYSWLMTLYRFMISFITGLFIFRQLESIGQQALIGGYLSGISVYLFIFLLSVED